MKENASLHFLVTLVSHVSGAQSPRGAGGGRTGRACPPSKFHRTAAVSSPEQPHEVETVAPFHGRRSRGLGRGETRRSRGQRGTEGRRAQVHASQCGPGVGAHTRPAAQRAASRDRGAKAGQQATRAHGPVPPAGQTLGVGPPEPGPRRPDPLAGAPGDVGRALRNILKAREWYRNGGNNPRGRPRGSAWGPSIRWDVARPAQVRGTDAPHPRIEADPRTQMLSGGSVTEGHSVCDR